MPFNWHIIHASIELVSATMHIRRLFLAILSISFFWTIGAVLIIIFPPLVKNVLGGERAGREPVHRHLLGRHRDRLGRDQPPAQERGLGALRAGLRDRHGRVRAAAALRRVGVGQERAGTDHARQFPVQPDGGPDDPCLLGVAITGGMFVVPLYAFLTTTVPKTETARTVAANNIVNSGAMVIGSLLAFALSSLGRRARRPAAAGRRDVPGFGLARL